MKSLCLGLSAALLATSAAAGNMVIPSPAAPAPAPAVAAAPGWSGAYAGGMAAFGTGTAEYFIDEFFSNGPWDLSGTQFGGFAGYNIQTGNIVFGGELAYGFGDIASELGAAPYSRYTDMLDLKGRVGFAAGNALLYGVVGWSMGSWTEQTGMLAPTRHTGSGLAYGAGVDLMVTDRLFVGAEFLMRDLIITDFDMYLPEVVEIEAPVQTVTARVGFRF